MNSLPQNFTGVNPPNFDVDALVAEARNLTPTTPTPPASGVQRRESQPNRGERPVANPKPAATPAAQPDQKQLPVVKRWTVAELYNTVFPALYFAVSGLLPAGLSFLIARPKIGKSWLALLIAVAVATGGMVFGERVERGPVLYLALEDRERRMKSRLQKQLAPADCDLTIMHTWPLLTRGGVEMLKAEISANNYKLVIIDTLQRAVGGGDLMDQGVMNSILAPLQEFAQENNVAILMIHHRRKLGGDNQNDVIDDTLGATSISGVGDAYLGIHRKRGERVATLQITGRDIDEREMSIVFDPTNCTWQLANNADGVRANSLQAEIIKTLKLPDFDGEATTKQLASWLKRDAGTISNELAELVASGLVERGVKKGKTQPYLLVQRGVAFHTIDTIIQG